MIIEKDFDNCHHTLSERMLRKSGAKANMDHTNQKTPIRSPLNGLVMSLDKVNDEVFSARVLGDGCAILPTDGHLVSPINGKITSIAETKHAYGFESEDGTEILVHFGLETVALKGEGFISHVKVGETVKVGDLIAEADLSLLKERGIDLTTPVIVTNGDNQPFSVTEGAVKRGDVLLSHKESQAPKRHTKPSDKKPKKRKKNGTKKKKPQPEPVQEVPEEPVIVERIVETIHSVLERTPPELVADISDNGITMTGGGSLVVGFDKLITARTGIHTHIAEDAVSCVAIGTGKSLDSLSNMQDGTMNLSRRRQMN